ncbi:MAG: hypothetical protein K2L22_06915, partial [Muribaculaceae bacterium]|nr:hypothetical protein [Muribaculaceae bacterium]
ILTFAAESKKYEFLSPATPVSGPLTVFVNMCDSTLEFFETEHLGHWIWGDTVCRGVARLRHIRHDFYQLEGNLPGSYCMDSIRIQKIPQRGSSINLRINLPYLKYAFAVMAQPVGKDFVIEKSYDNKSCIRIPINKNGYRLAIAIRHPAGYFPLNSICFSNTIKFLLFPELDPSLFRNGCDLIIDLPLFDENCFFEWNLNGEIVRMNEDTLIYKNIIYVRTNN